MADRPALPTSRPDPYRVLDVPRDADASTVSRAYWRLAKQFHPDRNPSPLGRRLMLVVNDAYETLKNPERRAAYDRSVQGQQGGGILKHSEHPAGTAGSAADGIPAAHPSNPEPATGPIGRRAEQHRMATEGTAAPSTHARRFEWGRYAGRTFAEVAAVDPDYLEWFIRTPLGRSFAADIAAATGR